MTFYSPMKQMMSHQVVSMITSEEKYFSPHSLKNVELYSKYSADVVENAGKSDIHLTMKSCVSAQRMNDRPPNHCLHQMFYQRPKGLFLDESPRPGLVEDKVRMCLQCQIINASTVVLLVCIHSLGKPTMPQESTCLEEFNQKLTD